MSPPRDGQPSLSQLAQFFPVFFQPPSMCRSQRNVPFQVVGTLGQSAKLMRSASALARMALLNLLFLYLFSACIHRMCLFTSSGIVRMKTRTSVQRFYTFDKLTYWTGSSGKMVVRKRISSGVSCFRSINR